MENYSQLSSKLGVVRRAWKRMAAISGLAIVLIESTGIFTVLMLADWIYGARPVPRLIAYAVALILVVIIFTRNVLKPLFRKIPDEQIALYIEEHNKEFEGSLMSAAEFGKGGGQTEEQSKLIDAIIASAVARTEKHNVKSFVPLTRLRKYGIVALILLVSYAVTSILFPDTLGKRALRILTFTPPPPPPMTAEQLAKLPMEFNLSTTDANIPKGSSLTFEATLSRTPQESVVFNFMPESEAGKGAWRALPMEELDKLHGYKMFLPDINETTTFYVSSGAHKSQQYKITVFEPFTLQGFEVVTRYPEAYRMPEVVETQGVVNVSAVAGSKILVRILGNKKISGATLTWTSGGTVKFTPDKERDTTAFASFDITKSDTGKLKVTDIDKQEYEVPEQVEIALVKDQPPVLEIKTPVGTVAMNPLGELMVRAKIEDDFGIDTVDMVYFRGNDKSEGKRLKLTPVTKEGGIPKKTMGVNYAFRLADLKPEVAREEVLSFYLESKDRKGQSGVSDFGMIAVGYFEMWGVMNMETPPAHMEIAVTKDLEPYLNAAWHLHTQKPVLPEDDFKTQAKELADSALDPATKQLYSFAEPIDKTNQEQIDACKKIAEMIRRGHDALKKNDTQTTVTEWRLALAEIQLLGVEDIAEITLPPENQQAQAATTKEMNDVFQSFKSEPPPETKEQKEAKMKAAENEKTKQDKKAEEMANVVTDLTRIMENQQEIRKETEKNVAETPEQKKDAKSEKDMKKLVLNQVEIKAKTDAVEKQIEKMRSTAAAEMKPETAKKIEEAYKALQRTQPSQKMVNATVELNAFKPKSAVPEQKKAEEALAKVLEAMKNASDTMAADSKAELKRAKNEAEKLANEVAKLDKKPEAKPEQKPEEKPQPKPDEKNAKGEQKPQPKPEDKATAKPEQKKELTPQERKEAAEKANALAKQLVEHMENREFGKKEDREKLKELTKDPQLQKKLEEDEKKLDEMKDVVARIKNKLEEEYDTKMTGQRLFSAQREECPPQYRNLVNKYYESLSQKEEVK
ncbi:MAG TPA: hypothetical protein DET40_13000 [Lentisphaeria bacterium]|nr:MAG: hypothetical protein A2X45_19165 [Lentisphaerae bacterium GWF2_50_93]HCE44459.1 hypothetical protein [Lentisphaeria bacterium]